MMRNAQRVKPKQAHKPNQANALKAKIHIGKKDLCLDDATYRDVLIRITGKDSSSKMTLGELEAVVKEMKRLGFKPKPSAKTQKNYGKKPNAAKSRQALINKIEAILAEKGLHWNYAHGIAKKMFGCDRCHWLSEDKLYKLTQALATYQARHKKKFLKSTKQKVGNKKTQVVQLEFLECKGEQSLHLFIVTDN